MHVELPDKLYFKIGEVAKLAQVPTHVLRYWESEFEDIQPQRASSKQRLYRREDVELILKIKVLLHHKGYTIAGAKKIIARGGELDDQVAEPSPQNLSKALGDIKSELEQLRDFIARKK